MDPTTTKTTTNSTNSKPTTTTTKINKTYPSPPPISSSRNKSILVVVSSPSPSSLLMLFHLVVVSLLCLSLLILLLRGDIYDSNWNLLTTSIVPPPVHGLTFIIPRTAVYPILSTRGDSRSGGGGRGGLSCGSSSSSRSLLSAVTVSGGEISTVSSVSKVETDEVDQLMANTKGPIGRRKQQRMRMKTKVRNQKQQQQQLMPLSASSRLQQKREPVVDLTTHKIHRATFIVSDQETEHKDDENENDTENISNNQKVMAKIEFTTNVPKDHDDDKVVVVVDPTTLDQTVDRDVWMMLRGQICNISASQLSVVLNKSVFQSRSSLLHEKTTNAQYAKNSTTITTSNRTVNEAACRWGIEMEPHAFQQYHDVVGGVATNTDHGNDDDNDHHSTVYYEVMETGLHVLPVQDPLYPNRTYYVGASPDGIVHRKKRRRRRNTNTVIEHPVAQVDDVSTPSDGDDDKNNTDEINNNNNDDNITYYETMTSIGLLEIKSLWGRRHNVQLPKFEHCPNRYYDQIQGQLAVCNRPWCDLMCYIPPNGGGNGGGCNSNKARKRNNNKNRRPKHQTKLKRRLKERRRLKREAAASRATGSDEDDDDGNDRHIQWSGRNYCIVRVERNEQYWNETLLPAILAFCRELNDAQEEEERNKKSEQI